MEQLAGTEKIIALIGAIVVGVFALIALKADWKTSGLDNNVTKLLLGLMAFGCVLVIFTAVGVLGKFGQLVYDIKDSRGVPVSGGIPPIVRISAVIGVIIIFIIGGIVVGASRYGHMWPSTDSMHVKL